MLLDCVVGDTFDLCPGIQVELIGIIRRVVIHFVRLDRAQRPVERLRAALQAPANRSDALLILPQRLARGPPAKRFDS